MNIAVVAHDDRKVLMEQFCTAYKAILSNHNLIATGDAANILERTLDCSVQRCMSGSSGGKQQIVSLIACDEIDILLFFRSTVQFPFSDEDLNILRLCDRYFIPVATNLATAELLVLGLQNGDVDWRALHHAKSAE